MRGPRLSSAAGAAVLLLPGALVGVTAFFSGGFFPDVTGIACLVVLGALVVRLAAGGPLLPHARAGLLVAVAAFALFAGWVLLSSTWSDATSRALLEYQRVLLYLATLVLLALQRRTPGSARLLLGGLAAAGVVVSAAALGVWLWSDSFAVGAEFPRARLSWPTSYWNTTGLLGAFTVLWCLGLSCDLRAPAWARALAAGGVPLGAAVVFFTVSRGAALALAVGLVAFVLLRPSRGLLTGGLLALAGGLAAVLVAAGVDGLDVALPVPEPALADGHRAGWVLVGLALGSVAVRAALTVADRRLLTAPDLTSPGRVRAALLGVAVVAAAIALVAGGAERLGDAYDDFRQSDPVSSSTDPTERFRTIGNNGRIEHWRVALDLGFEAEPLHGTGAGTYALLWSEGRDRAFTVIDGHSLYLETMAELGIVGLALLVAGLGTLLVGLVRRAWSSGGAWLALAAAAAGWTVHAGIDWLWEVPAVTLPIFAAGGLALAPRRAADARPVEDVATWPRAAATVWAAGEEVATAAPTVVEDAPAPAARGRRAPTREQTVGVVLAVGCLVLAVLPFQIFRSQRALTTAIGDFRRGDCAATVRHALDATDAVSSRPEPFELLTYCNLRAGRDALARRTIDAAIRRDPGNWEFRYDDGLVAAIAGGDPRPALRAARVRNPLQAQIITLQEQIADARRSRWPRIARQAPALIPSR